MIEDSVEIGPVSDITFMKLIGRKALVKEGLISGRLNGRLMLS